jgi:MFS superfamily sulfate permease-like transporter
MSLALDAWLPKSVIVLREYTFEKFVDDLLAGMTVGLVALPLAMAFAIASGVLPQAGIYCAIVTGFLISALGGSKSKSGGQQEHSWLSYSESFPGTESMDCSPARCLRVFCW